MNYPSKKSVTDQGIADIGAAILRQLQLANMKPPQLAVNLPVKSCSVTDVYDEGTLNQIFIERIYASICQNSRLYWAQYPQADLSDFVFYGESLLFIKKIADVLKLPNQNMR